MNCGDKGFTLAELMVAILILTIGLLGLFQTVYSTIGFNLQNELRAEALVYGDEVMARDLSRPFDNITVSQGLAWTSPETQRRSLNNGMAIWQYSSVRSHNYISTNSTNVQVRISWKYKGTQYSHNLASVVSK